MAEEEYDYTKIPPVGSIEGVAAGAPEDDPRIGVYVCHCGINIKMAVDVDEVMRYAASLPNVVVARHYIFMCSDPGQDLIRKDLAAGTVNRVIVASCSPRMHEPTFRKTCADSGLNPFYYEMANIREHCSWPHGDFQKEATEKAKALVSSAVARSTLLEPIEEVVVDVTPEVLVIGGGVTGMYAALDIANGGYKVHLVEHTPSIGGHVAQLDRFFPTLERATSLLTPRMIEVGAHPNINLMAYSEVEEISGYIGNYDVKVKRKPRYIDSAKCKDCTPCIEACPVKDIPDEFNEGMSTRSAIYIPFPFAVPPAYTIDTEHCLLLKEGKCGDATLETIKEGKAVPPCMAACPGAIDFEQKEEIEELSLGTIIVATGYDLVDPRVTPEYKYGEYPNVITSLEFERLLSPSGPTGGKLELNGKVPKDIVFISCVGSRNKQVGNEYCSRVCCMYIAKQAAQAKEQLPDADVTVTFQDVRAFGKGFEEFYGDVKMGGVLYTRGLPSEIYKKPGSDRVMIRAENTLLGDPYEREADIVVLGMGLKPNKGVEPIINMLKLSKFVDGFLMEAHPKLRPVDTATDGIFIAGCCASPKDITDSIAQGKATASGSLLYLVQLKAKIEPAISQIDAEICIGCGTCAEGCPYGALELDEVLHVMMVNEAVCKGCGGCNAVCPSGAATMKHYRDRQVYAQIDALTEIGLHIEMATAGADAEVAATEPEAAEAAEAEPAAAE
ncbi:MAG: CoB--CoM heterodisulfide reductase iron-sulfur subunit A [Candidatus Methanophagaceae archaeon]|nr:MAG: CoB--CoM heterodisulfide reductase iron-sulfur subunit A [Methanophagales archaeon]